MNLEATPIHLRDEERAVLESLARSPTTEQRLADRARIVLLAAAGRSTRSIARALGDVAGAGEPLAHALRRAWP